MQAPRYSFTADVIFPFLFSHGSMKENQEIWKTHHQTYQRINKYLFYFFFCLICSHSWMRVQLCCSVTHVLGVAMHGYGWWGKLLCIFSKEPSPCTPPSCHCCTRTTGMRLLHPDEHLWQWSLPNNSQKGVRSPNPWGLTYWPYTKDVRYWWFFSVYLIKNYTL